MNIFVFSRDSFRQIRQLVLVFGALGAFGSVTTCLSCFYPALFWTFAQWAPTNLAATQSLSGKLTAVVRHQAVVFPAKEEAAEEYHTTAAL